jgi:hypothetical protein
MAHVFLISDVHLELLTTARARKLVHQFKIHYGLPLSREELRAFRQQAVAAGLRLIPPRIEVVMPLDPGWF